MEFLLQTHQPKPQMASRVPLFSPKLHQKTLHFQTNFSFSAATHVKNREKSQLPCTRKITDAEIAADLAAEVAKMKNPLVQRKEAMAMSRELLFGEFSQFVGLREETLKQWWGNMDDVEKLDWVTRFVSDWSLAFHPLSARSVKELVEEHLMEENPSVVSSPSLMFPGLKKMLDFLEDRQKW